MMEVIHGDVDWTCFNNASSQFTATLIEDMSELLLEFSPRGVEFIENVVISNYDDCGKMERVQRMYDELSICKKDAPKQLVKVVAWYDNEMSYTSQMIKTMKVLLKK